MPKKRQSGQHGTKLAQERFLRHFADHFNIRKAAKAAKVSHQSVYNWLKGDAEFARRFAEAKQQAIDDLEAEARRRAVDENDTPVCVLAIPGATTGGGNNLPIPACGIAFSNGIAFRLTSGMANNNTGAVSAAEHTVSYSYK